MRICSIERIFFTAAMPSKLLFLPGALGAPQFWSPVANRLSHPAAKICVGWPGFGATPPNPDINGIEDLVTMVADMIDQPTALIAQSMGGVVALRAALEKPDLVTHLVLATTSGGIDMTRHAAQDWRSAFQEANPLLPRWFSMDRQDLTTELYKLRMPTLLLWGDADPISPVSVGKQLASLLPRAELHVIAGGDHGLANSRANDIVPLIDRHLARTEQPPSS